MTTKLHEALETLRAGRAVVADPAKFITGSIGKRDQFSFKNASPFEHCDDSYPLVCSWGALSKVTRKTPHALGYNELLPEDFDCAPAFLTKAAQNLFPDQGNIIAVNDGLGQEATIQMWDEAISLCEQAIKEYETGLEVANEDR